MKPELKQLETTLIAILDQLDYIKGSIGTMIYKLDTEYDVINWPIFRQNFDVISRQLTGLTSVLVRELGPDGSSISFPEKVRLGNHDTNLLKIESAYSETRETQDKVESKIDLEKIDSESEFANQLVQSMKETLLKQVARYRKTNGEGHIKRSHPPDCQESDDATGFTPLKVVIREGKADSNLMASSISVISDGTSTADDVEKCAIKKTRRRNKIKHLKKNLVLEPSADQ